MALTFATDAEVFLNINVHNNNIFFVILDFARISLTICSGCIALVSVHTTTPHHELMRPFSAARGLCYHIDWQLYFLEVLDHFGQCLPVCL